MQASTTNCNAADPGPLLPRLIAAAIPNPGTSRMMLSRIIAPTRAHQSASGAPYAVVLRTYAGGIAYPAGHCCIAGTAGPPQYPQNPWPAATAAPRRLQTRGAWPEPLTRTCSTDG